MHPVACGGDLDMYYFSFLMDFTCACDLTGRCVWLKPMGIARGFWLPFHSKIQKNFLLWVCGYLDITVKFNDVISRPNICDCILQTRASQFCMRHIQNVWSFKKCHISCNTKVRRKSSNGIYISFFSIAYVPCSPLCLRSWHIRVPFTNIS